MSALRVARAFTGRSRFVRFAGDYHGHSDEMIFSAGASSNSAAGLAAGITREASANAIVLPYDDVDAVSEAFELFGVEIAAVIVEPVCANMGLVVPQPGYLERLRAETARAGALLIFDEVITGFRLGLGGAQERFGVRPDLTCIGKALGGGLPIAAFGGRADVMATLAPEGRVFQGGTFSGNPVCVAAAHALIDRLEGDPDVYRRMDATAAQLAAGIERCLAQAGLPYPVVRIASIVDFMFRASPAHRTFDEACTADAEAYAAYYWAMLEHGVHLAPSQMEVMFVTAAHGDDDVAQTLAAIESSLTP